MEWKFESGIVGVKSNVFGAFSQRVYHVRYSSNTHLRRIITASFTYTKFVAEQKDNLIASLITGDVQSYTSSVDNTGALIPAMSNVVAIMDFDINETDQQPPKKAEVEGTFHLIHNDHQDTNDFTSLTHFETNLSKARFEKCVCTLTNDEEAKKRIDEILVSKTKTTHCPPEISSISRECCEHPELEKAIKRVFELEAMVIQQQHIIEDLKNKMF
jgi:hypothetical protein